MSANPGKRHRVITLVISSWVVAGLAYLLLVETRSAFIEFSGALLVFIFVAWLSEAFYIRVGKQLVVSATYAIEFAAMIIFGPLAAAVTSAASALNFRSFHSDWILHTERGLFNVAQLFFSMAVAGAVYLALGGPLAPYSAGDFPAVLLPLAAAAATHQILNMISVVVAISLASGSPFLANLYEYVKASNFQFITLALLGVMLAQVFGLIGAVGMLLLAVPLLVSRQVYAVYLKRKDAYLDSLGSLVAALEAKDRYTRGHSERVARLSVIAGEAMGLSQKQLDNLRLAGLLHDIGKISVRGAVLRKPGKLTDDEYVSIKDHPAKGAHIVEHIDLLQGAIPGIRFHHERPDGRGYYGLPKEDIPDMAKILSIADAYDSITSRRSYRDASSHNEAVRELRKWSGTQFDDEIVEQFISAQEANLAEA